VTKTLEQLDRENITRTLHQEGGHVESAAKKLGIARSSLYQKIKQYGIRKDRQRSQPAQASLPE